ncbi:hypothetical protein C8R44DRAFT_848538 [Mycena epipterygia]|nr:hypothetical protein C8R44DRAFT_848538 [Mycena epipterygia]
MLARSFTQHQILEVFPFGFIRPRGVAWYRLGSLGPLRGFPFIYIPLGVREMRSHPVRIVLSLRRTCSIPSPGRAWSSIRICAHTARRSILLTRLPSPTLAPGLAVRMVTVRVARIYAPLIGHAPLFPGTAPPDPTQLSRSRSPCPRHSSAPSDPSASATVARTFAVCCGLLAFMWLIDRMGSHSPCPRQSSVLLPTRALGQLPPRRSLHAAGVQARLVEPALFCSQNIRCAHRGRRCMAHRHPALVPVPRTLLHAGCIHAIRAVQRAGMLYGPRGLENCGIADMHRGFADDLLINHKCKKQLYLVSALQNGEGNGGEYEDWGLRESWM